MKRSILATAFLLLAVVHSLPLTAQERERAGLNLSVWKGVATQDADKQAATALNLGILSHCHRLTGVGINLLSGKAKASVQGLQVAGLANIAGGNAAGLQLAGIGNINGGSLAGLTLSGITNITGDNLRGLSLAGLTSIAGNNAYGLTAAGLANITGNRTQGISLGGLLNLNGSEGAGLHAGGLAHIAGNDFRGISIGGLASVGGGDMTGLQMAGLINVAGERLKGVQAGAMNVAVEARGVQIGLVNYYEKRLDGFQLGLVNANPHTRVQLMLFGGNGSKFNVGARFKNRLFYTILGAGSHYFGLGQDCSASFFYRAGLELPLWKSLHISGDLGFGHIEAFANRHHGYPERLYSLEARVNLECRLTPSFGLFASTGYGGSRHYDRPQGYRQGVIAEGGVILFGY